MSDAAARRRRVIAAVSAPAVFGLAVAWVADREDGDAVAQAEGAWTLRPYEGVGAWVDVYDWTEELTEAAPPVQPADVDRMADLGIDTLYIQTAHDRSAATGVIERERLVELIDRAHARGLRVVAWYLPTLVDVETDLARLVASAELPVDGLGVDIEALDVADVAERNARLLDLTARLRAAVGPDRALAAIVPSPGHLLVANPDFWPGFPWADLGEAYDVLLPMSYWSIRDATMGDGERYVGEDIDRLRAVTGDPDGPIHVIGGIADGISPDEAAGMAAAVEARGALGASLYDWVTSTDAQWAALAPLREAE